MFRRELAWCRRLVHYCASPNGKSSAQVRSPDRSVVEEASRYLFALTRNNTWDALAIVAVMWNAQRRCDLVVLILLTLSISRGACEALADRVALLCGLIKGLSVHVWEGGIIPLRSFIHPRHNHQRAGPSLPGIRPHACDSLCPVLHLPPLAGSLLLAEDG